MDSSLVDKLRGALQARAQAKADLAFIEATHLIRRPRAEFNLYFIQCGDLVKIGVAKDVSQRMATLQTGCPTPLSVVAVIKGKGKLEGELHRRFSEFRVNGEWFRFTSEIRKCIDELSKAT